MTILQINFSDVNDAELRSIPDFMQELASVIVTKLNTKINRKKIKLRLNYMLEDAEWVNWLPNLKYNTTIDDIINAIGKSITVREYKNNTWKLEVLEDIKIPNSITPISRFIRFFNYGDNVYHPTGFFTNLSGELRGNKIYSYWNLYLRTIGIYETNASLAVF